MIGKNIIYQNRKRGAFMAYGYLSVFTRTAGEGLPVEGAKVYVRILPQGQEISDSSVSSTYYSYLLTTNSSGITEFIRVPTPDAKESYIKDNTKLPYSLADIYIESNGYYPMRFNSIQIFPSTQSIVPADLVPLTPDYNIDDSTNGTITYDVPPNILFNPGTNTFQDTDMLLPGNNARPFVLESVFIPENVTVHLGTPSSSARNVTVPFTDYIKNVASSEIFPTWPENSLIANIHAIVSLTLNRIYTEWYPSQGYNFDITNTTQFDQAFVPGRNIFENISRLVDEYFNIYAVREGDESPLFTQFCDGKTVSCEGLSQWGTVFLAEQGYTPLQIIQYYYGDDVRLEQTNDIRSSPSSYPGISLSIGDSGDNVLEIQKQLMRVRENYPAIPLIPTIDGRFGASTDAAVRAFQEIFDLPVDGIVGKATWYRLSYIYSAVIKLAEVSGEGIPSIFENTVPGVTISIGERSDYALLLQLLLNYISYFYPTVQGTARDGIFGENTLDALISFQRTFGLMQTGTVNENVWQALYAVYRYILTLIRSTEENQQYPGTELATGASSDAVRQIQTYLSAIADRYPTVPKITADGVFGPATERAVISFQRSFGLPVTGRINAATWERIVEVYNFIQNQSQLN